ncbi:MAG: zinc ribbon domain-containing protein [Chloroflexi bacterium]|jgi:putative FmdB family regulatory protein|nr:zinc ribbon domain-containing protein [Chloroflexota bacterium]
MPIFEFICGECRHFFEELVRSAGSVNSITCPSCQSAQVKKQFSTFASKPGGSDSFAASSTPAPAASCNIGGL